MPSFERYSAVEMFGVPIDNPDTQMSLGGLSIIKLMTDYGVEPQPLPEEPTDITPFYGTNTSFRYYVSFSPENNLATVDLMPTTESSIIQDVDVEEGEEATFSQTSLRTIHIPTDQEMFAIAGSSPRFGADSLCIHELIAYRS